MKRRAFTLIELLAVIAILGLLAAILFPVFAHVRENGRRAMCLSDERQLGMAVMQYAADNEETFPAGTHGGGTSLPSSIRQESGGNGMGWAGEVYPYVKSASAFACPDDAPVSSVTAHVRGLDGVKLSLSGVPLSYGYNSGLAGGLVPGMPGINGKTDRLPQPSGTVLLFEITGDTVDVTQPDEGASQGVTLFSASGDGLGLGAAVAPQKDGRMPPLIVQGIFYATGRFVGASDRPPGDPDGGAGDFFPDPAGRHSGGSNFLLADGHVKWVLPEKVCAVAGPVGFPEANCAVHFW